LPGYSIRFRSPVRECRARNVNRETVEKDKKGELKMVEEVKKALELVRPALQADGGDVELVEVTDDGVVKVRLKGACGSCPMSTMTLKMGIERTLKDQIPGVKEVIGV
jgi:Fe-S cluster biogenesis protein NfuA